ncbi:MAG: hypothetical protein DMG86_09910 [Acidobacteria bacterium]|nr:MAG: hypothetical protein AUI85_05810 [Acidobacteriales bacterium 13_1_40CM_3_55_5]PYX01570.1 MAG: hypothetical protein DMG86_09910 [Acidobacteriota bacterium]
MAPLKPLSERHQSGKFGNACKANNSRVAALKPPPPALPNPGVPAWLSLAFRANLAPGENASFSVRPEVTGKLAVKICEAFSALQG